MVYLVGAGPGDPDLITVKGLKVLQRADVVLYDRLAHPDLLAMAPETALRIDVGKTPRDPHQTRQEHINALLVLHGQSAGVVVRLKGGDPFVFGRGIEEVRVLRGAGIPVQVVPGISSAIAGPAAAEIAVTERLVANAFGVFTAHEACTANCDGIPWAAAAALPTSVFLMGVERLSQIVFKLIEAGKDPSTPVAVISNATLPHQSVVRSTLEHICEHSEAIVSPSVIVVGEVAG